MQNSVVIIGGGFAGLNSAIKLAKENIKITLIDKRNFHLFQPLLYQVASGGLSPADISYPLRAIFKNMSNVQIINAEVQNVNFDKHSVFTEIGEIKYNYLIIATGSKTHYYGKDEWSNYAYGLKSIEDATEIRNLILSSFEKAENEIDKEKKQEYLTFTVVGGGPAGVELSGAIAELARMTLHCDFRNIDTKEIKILLIEGSDRLLPNYPENLSSKAKNDLEKLGVKIILNGLVKNISKNRVEIQLANHNEIINANSIIWTAGVKANSLAEKISQENHIKTDKSGRIIVNEFCEIENHKNVFVIGDLANFMVGNSPLPGIAPVAIQQGKYVARRIINFINNFSDEKTFKYFDKGNLAVIGRKAAVAFRNNISISGIFAWLIWLFVHILYLIGFQNRLLVSIQWAFNYFTAKKSARLITNISNNR